MNIQDLQQRLSALQPWSGDLKEIGASFSFPDFAAAMRFVNRVAELAEAQNHHPDIDIRYSKVHLALTSHDVGHVTERDLRLAAAILTATQA